MKTALRTPMLNLVLAIAALAVGCESRGRNHAASGAVRIVSLSPAVTQMVIDLGFGGRIVGIGEHDPGATPGTPVVGDLFQVDYEKLGSVEPTHVFIQPGRQGVPPRLREMGEVYGWSVYDYEIETIDDALNALYDPRSAYPEQTVGGALGVPKQARGLVNDVREQLMDLYDLHKESPVDGVLLLVGLNPITAAGPETFLSELLRIAGGKNAVSEGSQLYPVLDLEHVATMRPEVILFVQSTTGPMGEKGQKVEEIFSRLEIPAVAGRRVHEVSDAVALLPSSSMPRVAAKLAKTIHPDSSGRIEKIVKKTSLGR